MDKRLPTNKIFNDPLRFYFSMLRDIENATACIYLEIYRFHHDAMGIRFRNALIKKVQEGVSVKLLLDSWGTHPSSSFFNDLIKAGAEVVYYKKIKFFLDFFTKNHRRNHRKLLLIDHNISYIGSANISEYSLNWRECVLRITGNVTLEFEKVFLYDMKNHNRYEIKRKGFLKTLEKDGYAIIRDFPSITQQRVMSFYLNQIKRAQTEIMIETPYFLPGFQLRRALMRAALRGVQITIIIPRHSDVRAVDVLRSRYLGALHRSGIRLLFYTGDNLHAKDFLIDRERYAIGSSNFDYRSFRYQHEIIVSGKHLDIVQQLHYHIQSTIENTIAFDYENWLKRPKIQKFFEVLLLPFRHLL